MSNSVFDKTWQNQRYIKLITTEARTNYLVFEPITTQQSFARKSY